MSNFIKQKNEDLIVTYSIKGADILETIPPGYYELKNAGGMFERIMAYEPINLLETLIKFESGVVNTTINSINNFLSAEVIQSYKDLKVSHKLGIILYGPHGTGKTSTVSLIMNTLIKDREAICLDCTNDSLSFIIAGIENIRKHQNNPIIVFIDEIDDSFRKEENYYLPFLDGSNSFDNIIIIGCTNYIGRIPDRIKNRKSRIKHLIEIKAFPLEVYKEYIKEKLGSKISDADLTKFAYLAEENSLTIDSLKHAVIDYYIEKKSIEAAIKGCVEIGNEEVEIE